MGTLFIEKNKNKFLSGILLMALIARLWVFPVVFSGGHITLLGADTYYHARRILATVSHFPDTLAFDTYINFPMGSNIGWPPLYDQFIALTALLIGFGHPSVYTIEATAAVIPPLFGILTVLLVFLIAEKIFDWRVGLVSAGIFAITPAHVYVSFIGYADHHVAETLLSTAAYLFFVIALKRLQQSNINFGNFRTNLFKNSLYPALCGITLALSIFTWEGAPIFIGLIGTYILVQFVLDRKLNRNSDYLVLTGSLAFLVSVLIIAPVAWGKGFDTGTYLPSFFQVGFLSIFFFLCVFLGIMQKMNLKKWWYHPMILVLIFAAAVYSIKIFSLNFYLAAINRISYLFGGGILATIQEAVPLFNTPDGAFTLDNVWNAFTISFFIFLLSFVYFINRAIREKYPFEAVFLIVWTLIVLALTVLQKRFIYLLSVNVAIFSAYFIIASAGHFAPAKEKEAINAKKKRKGQQKPKPASNAGLFVGLFLLVLIGVPNITVIKTMATGVAAPNQDLQESLKWLKDNSPPTSYFDAPDKPPEYGVMSWWDYGNWILYISQRPVVANNFQTGIDDAAHFLTEPDEKTANEILGKRKVRFIITDAQMLKLKFKSIAMLAGKNPEDYYGTSDGAPIASVNAENKKFFETMLSKLHVFDGDGLNHYRLVYESKTTAIKSPDIKYVKIFEYVPGATITGKSEGDVSVSLSIMTNQGRTYVYTNQAAVKNGRYEIVVPYSTQGGEYWTKPLGDYIIQNANVSKAVSINEQDVQEGRKLEADLV